MSSTMTKIIHILFVFIIIFFYFMVAIYPIGVRVHFRDPERKLGDLHVRALCPPQRGGRAGAQDPPSHRQQGNNLPGSGFTVNKFCSKHCGSSVGSESALF